MIRLPGPRGLAGLVGVALAVSALAWWLGTPAFFTSWLVAWLFFLGLALGALVNVMIHELTGGDWGFAVRPPLEAAIGTFPLLALLALPLALGLPVLFPWARPEAAEHAHLAARLGYLNVPFFLVRVVACFAVWIAHAAVLRRFWRKRESNAGRVPVPALRATSIVGLLLVALTVTLAAIDWIMSLSPDWHSTMFGLLVMVGQALGAFCFAVAWSVFSGASASQRADIAGDLGNLLLMFVMLWAYLSYAQFLVVWAEDLPTEIGWYVVRAEPRWRWLAIAVLALQFALPFAAMLFRPFKRDPRRLAWLCVAVLAAHAAEVFWLVAPELRVAQPGLSWTDPIAFLAVGGLWWTAFLRAGVGSAPASARVEGAVTDRG